MNSGDDREKGEQGLVDIYAGPIQGLAVLSLSGEDVSARVDEQVEKAAHHFSVVATSPELANLKLLAGTLGMIAAVTHESQPKKRETLEYAVGLVKAKIAEKESQQNSH